jgi:hypothetical protein
MVLLTPITALRSVVHHTSNGVHCAHALTSAVGMRRPLG